MFKVTPNPPEAEDTSPDTSIDTQKLHEAADRALEEYIKLSTRINAIERKPSTMFVIAPDIDTESLLAHACESLASARIVADNFAGCLKGSLRNTMLAISQIIMLSELAVNRALDNIDPQGWLRIRVRHNSCESEPASEGGASVDISVGWDGLFASRLAPTGFV
jgi:hypothetical protein